MPKNTTATSTHDDSLSNRTYHSLEYLTKNIQQLLSSPHLNTSQSKMAAEFGVSQTQISKIQHGQRTPDLQFALCLCEKFALSMDLLKSRLLSSEEIAALLEENTPAGSPQEISILNKYAGIYFAYYFFNGDSSMDKTQEQLLDYGLIDVCESDGSSSFQLKAQAIMGIHNLDTLLKIHAELREKDRASREAYYSKTISSKHMYQGWLRLSHEHENFFVIDLNRGMDSAHLLFQRPTLNDRLTYLGGLGTINSISKKQSLPCIQYVAISKPELTPIAEEEIASHLYMGRSRLDSLELHHIFLFIDKLYRELNLDREQLSFVIESYLKSRIEQLMNGQQLRFHHVEKEDREWYELIKSYLKKEEHHGGHQRKSSHQ